MHQSNCFHCFHAEVPHKDISPNPENTSGAYQENSDLTSVLDGFRVEGVLNWLSKRLRGWILAVLPRILLLYNLEEGQTHAYWSVNRHNGRKQFLKPFWRSLPLSDFCLLLHSFHCSFFTFPGFLWFFLLLPDPCSISQFSAAPC